jgi:cysteine desulfurase / selenocysteine lyase
MTVDRIYLDNAATSWPKPESVYQTVDRYMRHSGASAGRGVYREGVEADRIVVAARERIARLINAPSASCIVFTHNGTHALNLAIHGLLQPGDRVITTDLEHNSVLRPLHVEQRRRQVDVTFLRSDAGGIVDAASLEAALREPARLLVCTHASNVTGAIQPIGEIGEKAHRRETPNILLLDAAQTAGHVPIDVQAMQIDLLASSGHKGLLGPLGTGFLYIAPGLEEHIEPFMQGGTGTLSDEPEQPAAMPDRYESGNANVPGLAGLAAGVEYLLENGVDAIHARERRLIERLMAGLSELPGVSMYGPPPGADRVGLVAMTVEGYDPRELASLLDANFGIQVRAGLHCAPRIHEWLGLAPTGSVRMSVGPFTTDEEIDRTLHAWRDIVRA